MSKANDIGCGCLTWGAFIGGGVGICWVAWQIHPIAGVCAALLIFGSGGAAARR
jgi:hypothetical protein